MTDERYLELKKSGIYAKQSKILIRLNDIYTKFMYLSSIVEIETEKERLKQLLN